MHAQREDGPLAGWYVISLRPSGGHAPVRRAASALGARTLPVSTLALRALDPGPSLAAALACPAVVFTSPAAVRFARARQPLQPAPGQRWYAVGRGTAAALLRAGVTGVLAPAGRGESETLLALPGLEAGGGRDVGVVTAPGGRGLIAEELGRRGFLVHRAEVYQRVPVRPRADRLAALAALPESSALLVSSREAFDGFWSWLEAPVKETLQRRPAVASSPRLAAYLAASGFRRLVMADGAMPTQMLRALAADVGAGRFR